MNKGDKVQVFFGCQWHDGEIIEIRKMPGRPDRYIVKGDGFRVMSGRAGLRLV